MNILAQLKSSLSDRYEMEREIGAGGMATVYLARDLRHDRPVAVKVLNPDLGAVLGVERFLAEIKVTANLQHPNLLPLFDSGEAGGLLFYVMPFVDGESLRAKLMREKQLPIDEAVRITVAIASALDYAHSHGVIHRDLKPENILMQSGQPVIADFGIALAVSKAGGNRVTQTGISLGTPQYMSPEQATGDRVIDGRSDIYSLAAISYEMLTGEPPHQGNTAQAIIARVLTERPRSIRLARESVPEHVAAAVEHGLEKLAADRYSTAREFGEAVQGRGMTAAQTTARTAAHAPALTWQSRMRDPVVLTIGAIGLAGVAMAIVSGLRPRAEDTLPPLQYVLWASDSTKPVDNFPWPAAISPDGSTIVYSVAAGDRTTLYALRTDQLDSHPIPGTSGGTQPLFSPDGQWIAFEGGGKERKVKLDGSAPVTIANSAANNGADWTVNDELFVGATDVRRGVSRVSTAGGDPVELTHPDQSHGPRDHVWPIATPDGRVIVYAVWTGSLSASQLEAAKVSDGVSVQLGIKGIRPLAVLEGVLVYVQADGAVMAVPFDERRLSAGKPIPVHDPVPILAGNNGNSGVFISHGGAMVSSRGGSYGKLAWIDRSGSARPISQEVRGFVLPRLSPDGKRVGVIIAENQRSDVWVFDLATSTLSRLTTVETVSYFEWTPDGKNIIYSATAEGGDARNAAWMQLAAGGSAPVRIADFPELTPAVARSPDGKWLVAQALHNNGWDLTAVRADSPGVRRPYIATPAQEVQPAFSPDGKWIAMVSDESGRFEVYIRSFPDPSVRVQVSVNGGGLPSWAPDGSSLFYSSTTAIMRARLSPAPAMHVVSRDTAFTLKPGLFTGSLFDRGFDIARDGQRVLGLMSSKDDYQLLVAPNWRTELRRRLAAASHSGQK